MRCRRSRQRRDVPLVRSWEEEDAFLAQVAAASISPPAPRKNTPQRQPQATPQKRVGIATEAFRVLAGGTRDAVQGAFDAADDIAAEADAWTYRKWGVRAPVVTFGSYAQNGVIGVEDGTAAAQRLAAERRPVGFQAKTWVPRVTEAATPVGRFGRDVVEFGVGFATGMKALKGLEGLGTVARYGRVTLAGAGAAFANVEPMQGNLANMAKALGIPDTALTEALAVDEDDTAIEARLKNAASDAVGGFAFDAAFKLVATGVRHARGLRVAKDAIERQASVPDDVLRHDPRLDEQAAEALAETTTAKAAPSATAERPAATGPDGQLPLFDDLQAAPKPSQADQLEQTLLDIPSKMQGLDEAALTSLARSFHDGTGYEVLERLGLNPARIDFAKVLSDGDLSVGRVSEIVERVAEAVQPLAQRAGSQPRSWNQTAALANLLGSSESAVVEAFKGATNMLDAKAWAARQLLGGSAARLTKLAEVAREFAEDAASPQYVEFLRALEAQAALQAQFKAATSNLGRALNSLKGTAVARDAAQRARRIRSVVDGGDGGASVRSAEDALRALGDAKSSAQRKLLIDRIIQARGDTAAVVRLAENHSGAGRYRRALREFVVGNLFSVGTATVNMVSTAGHIGFRALSHLPVHAFAYASGRAGGREYVAQRVADSTYLQAIIPAFGRGMARTVRLLSDELTEEIQGLAGSFGQNALEGGLGRMRQQMDEKWGAFTPRFERPDASHTKAWRVSKETVEQLFDNTDQLPALMRIGLRGLLGIGTGAFNAVGATSRVIRLATIDTTDELFGAVSQHATQAAEAARMAALEGFDRGLQGPALADFTRQRADVLLANSSKEMLERIERLVALGAKEDSDEVMELAAEAARVLDLEEVSAAEARKVLFQDSLDWRFSQSPARHLPMWDGNTGLLFPFIRTPLKILETTLGDYTPLGLLQKETRDRMMSGGIDAQIAISQMAMGTLAIGSAASLAAAGYVVGYDGGPRSSTRLVRPSYSMNVGGKWVEFSRFDPFGMLLGLGADLHEYALNGDTNEEMDDGGPSGAERAFSGMALSISRNILSKTWLTGARDIIGAAAGGSDGETQSALQRVADSTIQKLIPAGGMLRWWEGEDTNVTREAATRWEKVMASTPWASDLPERRDPLLGRAVPYDRVLGINVKDVDDPLLRELAELSFDLPPNSRSFRGVQLNSKQLARVKELRGQVVTDDTGLTLEEQLRELVASPDWAEMDRTQRIKAVRSLREEYHPLAIEALREEDREFDAAVGTVKLRRTLERQGYTQPEISAELQAFRDEVLLGN